MFRLVELENALFWDLEVVCIRVIDGCKYAIIQTGEEKK